MQTTIAHDIRGTLRLMRSQPVLSAAIVLMRFTVPSSYDEPRLS